MKEYQEPLLEVIDFSLSEDIYANGLSGQTGGSTGGVSGGEPSINIGGW
ncbi:MAG: hypothetical protein HUJ56_00190 [Erysipelotrichaceae bacterium]|nr:hypothetical protein [Erysipelotrichaceae bacterium]